MDTEFNFHKVGQLRPSQMLHTYGVGSIVDLPNMAVIILGLDAWTPYLSNMAAVKDERLLSAVKARLGDQVRRLMAPPIPENPLDGGSPFEQEERIGVPVALFPRWLRCPHCNLLARVDSGLFQFKRDPFHPDKTRYVHQNCSSSRKGTAPTAIPARFLTACSRGHLDDFPWIHYVHNGSKCDAPQLYLEESGAAGTAYELWVRCATCGRKRTMSLAFETDAKNHLPRCRGRRPHLRDKEEKGCDEPMKTLLLGASNSWFSVNLSLFSLPTAKDRLAQAVDENWSDLSVAVTIEVLKAIRQVLVNNGKAPELEEFTDEEIWAAMEVKRAGAEIPPGEPAHDLKRPEWELFANPEKAPSMKNFLLRVVEPPHGFRRFFTRVTAADRLREVKALVGFTRLESPWDYLEAGDYPQELIAPLSVKPPEWVPAGETLGEGVFIQFDETRLHEWERKPKVIER